MRDGPGEAKRGTGWTPIVVVGVVLFGALSWQLRQQQREVVGAGWLGDTAADGAERPVAEVTRTVRAAKLITIELLTTVTARSESESWRGDVSATVKAPVRLLFGTDLSSLGDNAVRVDPFGRAIVVTIPSPRRLATEVLGQGETSEVSTGWLRLRSVAGEYHLGLARRGLYEAARRMTLHPGDAQQVEQATREQVESLVRAIAGERTAVEVRFAEALP